MNLDRRSQIAEIINREGSMKNEDIKERFGISIETVRRDLASLEKKGLIEKVYGGAVRKTFMTTEPNFINRETVNTNEKLKIAYEAEKLITSGDIVYFDIGTNVLFLAQQLNENKKIHAFTNAIRTAVELSKKGCDVVIPGGQLRANELAMSGILAYENIKNFNVDKVFIGVGGITKDGITDFIPEEAQIRRRIIKNAGKVIALADCSKFGVRAMCNVCAINDIDILICDEKSPLSMLHEIEKKGVKVIIAK